MKKALFPLMVIVILVMPGCIQEQASNDIVLAVQIGNLESVKEAVSSKADINVTFSTSRGGNPLHKMSIYEYVLWEEGAFAYGQIADYLLERGADPNVFGPGDFSPLMNAAGAGDIPACEKYLQYGADVNLSNHRGWTALDEAAYRGETRAIRFLLDNGATPKLDSLQIAMEYKNYGSANLLAKALQERTVATNLSPSLLAAVTGESQGVIQRCKAGELTQEEQVEVGYYTAAFCSPEALDVCIAHGFDLEQEMPLTIAAEQGNLETVQYLLEQHADAARKNIPYALRAAARNDDLALAEYLLGTGASILPDELYDSPICSAAGNGSLRVLKCLLDTGETISHGTLEIALTEAAHGGYLEAMQILFPLRKWSIEELNAQWSGSILPEQRELCLTYGAKPAAEDMIIALSLAVEHGNLEMAQYLLSKGVDPSAVREDGAYSLEFAVQYGFYDIAELLIEHGADVNYSNEANANCSLLHTAAMSSTNLTRLLVEHGAQVNVQTTQGDTPLMYAVESGKPATVAVLLQAGADASISNKDGKTARELAEKSGDEEMMALFS